MADPNLFHFVDKTNTTIFEVVHTAFQNFLYVGFYVAAMLVLAVHISHGFWSAFQTLGMNHSKYMPIISAAGLVFALLVGVGFGFIPIYIVFGA